LSRKSIVVPLLLVGLLLLSCNLVTINIDTQDQATATTAPPADTVEPSVTPVPTEVYVEPAPTRKPAKPTLTPTEARLFAAPFEGWPEEYKVIQLPPELQAMTLVGKASVVPLPTDKRTYTDQIYSLVQDEGYLGPFDFERLANFEDQSTFAAVPARFIPEFPDFTDHGVMVGLVYDQNAFYGINRLEVYEVYFFDKKAEVRDRNGKVVKTLISGRDYFWTESKSNPEPLAFFVKNGCWLCWNAGGRTGCLICF
jgi:hypothetical protein